MNAMMRRLVGVVWFLTSLAWVAASLAGLIYGSRWLAQVSVRLDENLEVAAESLETIQAILVESGDTLNATEETLTTVQTATVDVAVLLFDLRPLVWKTSQTITQDIPEALDEVQLAMPSVIETAKAVDETLSWLSGFSINIPTFLGDPIVLDLGVDYDPEVPLDEALSTVSDSLVDIPDSLRSLEGSLMDTELNLLVVRNDLNALAENLDTANQQLAEVAPELEALAEDVAEIQLILEESQNKLPEQVRLIRYLLWGLSWMVMLSQIPGLYFGIVLQRHELAKSA